MSSKTIQKLLVLLFTGIFFALLVIGVGRIKKITIEDVVPSTDTPHTTTPQPTAIDTKATTTPKTASTTTIKTTPAKTPSQKPATVPTVPKTTTTPKTTPVTTTKPPVTQPPVVTPPQIVDYTGTTYQTPWGDVTVRISASSKTIGSVTTIHYPNSPPSEYAHPILIEQALKSGTANIQGVSGATYTSLAFKKSLESAIAQIQ